MSRHRVVHACGHDRDHDLFGRRDQRDRKQQWLSEQECWDCVCAEQNARACARAAEAGLPAIFGSGDKQIDWAVSIRDEVLADFDRRFGDTDTVRERALAILLRETRARRWIDLRPATANFALMGLCAPGEYRDLTPSKESS